MSVPLARAADMPRYGAALFWIEVLALFAFALFVHLFRTSLDHPLLVSEAYHVLAARSWMTDGTLAIADGVYPRAAAYTIVVSWLFSVFGESLAVARIFSVLVGSLWVVVAFAWVRHVAGRPAAWIAALLFCLSPETVFLLHYIRLYALHGLVFFLGAAGFYFLLTRRAAAPVTVALASGTVLALALAMHLQLTTIIGLVGLAIWALIELGPRWLAKAATDPRQWWLLGALVLLGLLVVAFAVQSGLAADLLDIYRWAALWNIAGKDTLLFYHYVFLEQYPVLWSLLPVAALIAVTRRPQPAVFCICVFATVLVLHSFAGMKEERYLFYGMPFFFALWGIAFAEAAPHLRALVAAATSRLFGAEAPRPLRVAVEWASIGATIAFLLAGTPGLASAVKMMQRWPDFPTHPASAWADARPILQPWLDKVDVILTTNDVHTIYYFGRYDYQISKYRVTETDTGADFGIDPRTGRPAISKVESVRLLLACNPSGLFVGNAYQWRHPIMGVSDEVADLIAAQAEPIPVPEAWGLRAYAWQRDEASVPPECSALPPRAAGRGGAKT